MKLRSHNESKSFKIDYTAKIPNGSLNVLKVLGFWLPIGQNFAFPNNAYRISICTHTWARVPALGVKCGREGGPAFSDTQGGGWTPPLCPSMCAAHCH